MANHVEGLTALIVLFDQFRGQDPTRGEGGFPVLEGTHRRAIAQFLNDRGVQVVPRGWRLVPEEPTEVMIEAAISRKYAGMPAVLRECIRHAPEAP